MWVIPAGGSAAHTQTASASAPAGKRASSGPRNGAPAGRRLRPRRAARQLRFQERRAGGQVGVSLAAREPREIFRENAVLATVEDANAGRLAECTTVSGRADEDRLPALPALLAQALQRPQQPLAILGARLDHECGVVLPRGAHRTHGEAV